MNGTYSKRSGQCFSADYPNFILETLKLVRHFEMAATDLKIELGESSMKPIIMRGHTQKSVRQEGSK